MVFDFFGVGAGTFCVQISEKSNPAVQLGASVLSDRLQNPPVFTVINPPRVTSQMSAVFVVNHHQPTSWPRGVTG
jgi:hypothetical protein